MLEVYCTSLALPLEALLMEVCWLSLGKMPHLQGRVHRWGGKETTLTAEKFLTPVCAETGSPHWCSRRVSGG